MNNVEYKVGESVVLGDKQYIVSGINEKGAYILKTPYEIRREQNARYNINDEIKIDGISHFITEIVDGKFILKTFSEIYDESCCKVCKFFCKDNGWMPKDRVNPNAKLPVVFGCMLGQFAQSYKVTDLKKQCNFKNYVYKPREEVRKEIQKMIDKHPENFKMFGINPLGKIMRPIDKYSVLGIEVIDAEKESVTIKHAKNFGDIE